MSKFSLHIGNEITELFDHDDYDLFHRDAEVSALGGSGHCHSHKPKSRISKSKDMAFNSELLLIH